MNNEFFKITGIAVAAIIGIGLVIVYWPVVVALLALFGFGLLIHFLCAR